MTQVAPSVPDARFVLDWLDRAIEGVHPDWLGPMTPFSERALPVILNSGSGRRCLTLRFRSRYGWPRAPSQPRAHYPQWVFLARDGLHELALQLGALQCAAALRALVSGRHVAVLRATLGAAVYATALDDDRTQPLAGLISVSPDCLAAIVEQGRGHTFVSLLGAEVLMAAATDSFSRDCVRYAWPPDARFVSKVRGEAGAHVSSIANMRRRVPS